MIYTAKNLLPKLHHLTLVGQNKDKELEWVGTDRMWNLTVFEEELNTNNGTLHNRMAGDEGNFNR